MSKWRIQFTTGGREPAPVLIDGDHLTSRGGFVDALHRIGYRSDHVFVDGERWSSTDETPVGESELHNGAIVADQPGEPIPMAAGSYLVVVGGPASGTAARLEPNRPLVVGRAAEAADLAIADELLSARHFSVLADDADRIRATDLGSTNGTLHEGKPLTDAEFAEDTIVQAGSSLFTILRLAADDRAIIRGATSTGLNLHRQFREAVIDLPPPPRGPKRPGQSSDASGSTWWRSMMPLVSAIGMAWMFGRWEFLLIAALAPIVYGIDNYRRRKQRQQEHESEQAEYERKLDRHRATMTGYREREVKRARSVAVSGGEAALFSAFQHRRVWERRPTDPDFLSGTLGCATLPSEHPDERDDGDDSPTDDLLWQVPLSVSLRDEGPVSISGAPDRAAAVVRSMLTEIMFTHAPIDLKLWVLTGDGRDDDWRFVQWLPHAFNEHGGANLAASDSGRAALMKSLRAIIEGRREEGGKDAVPTLPMHLVVVDGVDSLSPADLTELLRDGPPVGVYGIVTDPDVVPEGVRAEVILGRFDDECTYRSEITPRVDHVVVSQLAAEVAHEAALGLAPLEAFGRSGAPRLTDTVFYTEMIGYGDSDESDQLDRWVSTSPTNAVPVGIDLDGQPITVDLVRQGPHGLVGGTTRSGKTEFIKTYLASLAVHNTPEELAMVIVDFKNAVDYPELATLPHVLAVATNSNADLFDRTLTLLMAELDRRGHLFREVAGVATLEGYQTARTSNPDLPPVPRLLLVVDEFAKLMNSEEGSAQIKRLEDLSLAGAAFGMHLLLITQDFTGKLPPQINEQSGLRICFKVLSNGPSKAVLDANAAATISAATPGRAYLRSKGGDLVQFQSARIANRALNLGGDATELSAHHVTIDSLTSPPEAPKHPEAPNHEQDLYRVVQTAKRAAEGAGMSQSPVPWPAHVPSRVGLSALYERFASDGAVTIGVADEPTSQRMVPIEFRFEEAVVALCGSPESDHHDALFSIAASISARYRADEVHIYGIDLLGRGLGLIEALPHVGSVATRDDATGVRILNWLIGETAARRSSITRAGATDFESYLELGGEPLPRLVLLIMGADRMVLHSEGGHSPLLQPMTKLLNEATGTGIQVVFTGNPTMLSTRFGTAASRRLAFAFNDPADYPSQVPKALRSQIDEPGRCVDLGTGLLGQFAAVGDARGWDACLGRGGADPGDDRAADPPVSHRDYFRALAAECRSRHGVTTRPRSFAPAPWPLYLDDVKPEALTSYPPGIETPLPFGVRPDSGEIFWLDPREDGRALRIVGGPKSGRSNALAAIAAHAAPCGWDVLVAAVSRRSSLLEIDMVAPLLIDPYEMVERVTGGVPRQTLLLVDDAHRLDEEFPWKEIANVEHGLVVTVVAGSIDGLTSMQFNRRLGVGGGAVLMPTKARDANAVGAGSVDDDWVLNPLAGVGIAGIASEAHRVQFPLVG